MSKIRKSLLQLLFSGTYIQRWNDKLRPTALYELDKQGHKMIVAFLLVKLNSRNMSLDERLALEKAVVERSLFDYLYRLVVTDIKPPVFYRIKDNPKHYLELTEWVLTELQPVVEPLDAGFWQRLEAYHRNLERHELADQIVNAAHLYASHWEFGLIREFNKEDEERIEASFIEGFNGISKVSGLCELRQGNQNPLGHFANMCGQLRFQIRWSGTPRIPETSVLGHMFLVGTFAYFISLVLNACPARCLNNFFAGLFHDLPELLTRDIISPVKRSGQHLAELIRSYELEELEERIFKPLNQGGYTDINECLQYYLGMQGDGDSEFLETIRQNGSVTVLDDFDSMQAMYNCNELDPKDGILIKHCDNLAAFIEAHTSVRNGISTTALSEGLARIRNMFRKQKLGNLLLDTIIADFD